MWVLKLSGGLTRDPLLPAWLQLVAQLGGGRIAVVPGRGLLAGELRAAQSHWALDPAAAHNMSVLAMAQQAYLLHGLEPGLPLASSEAEIRHVLRRGRAAVWRPFDLLRDQPDASMRADATSDGLALTLAERLNAERLILVKSVPVDRSVTLEEQAQSGLVDAAFAARAREAAFPIELLSRDDLSLARALLLGAPCILP